MPLSLLSNISTGLLYIFKQFLFSPFNIWIDLGFAFKFDFIHNDDIMQDKDIDLVAKVCCIN